MIPLKGSRFAQTASAVTHFIKTALISLTALSTDPPPVIQPGSQFLRSQENGSPPLCLVEKSAGFEFVCWRMRGKDKLAGRIMTSNGGGGSKTGPNPFKFLLFGFPSVFVREINYFPFRRGVKSPDSTDSFVFHNRWIRSLPVKKHNSCV